jgi:four helix bundle protein
MGVERLDDLIAWRLAVEFRDAVYGLLRSSGPATSDVRYRDQLRNAAAGVSANVAEGFHRAGAKEFRQFLSYARASLAEAEDRLKDGIARDYFTADQCAAALLLAKRCSMAILRLIQSLERFVRK